MIVLGVETSCDETSAGIVEGGRRILSNVVLSQEIHSEYGGVVPEIASRIHIAEIVGIVDRALGRARVDLDRIDGLAVTYGPGLVGCLLVGLSFVKSLHIARNIPFVGVNHLEGHIFAGRLDHPELKVPHIALVASGGHANLYLVKDWGDYTLLGETRDDAPGEAFDKVAKLLGLGYPGGPEIEIASRTGDPSFVRFPRAKMGSGNLEFSFSGVKTAVAVYLRNKSEKFIREHISDLAASFQESVVETLAAKAVEAARQFNVGQISVTGGVARNSRLREIMTAHDSSDLEIFFPSLELCTDNGAMVAACGGFHLSRGESSDLTLNAIPYLQL